MLALEFAVTRMMDEDPTVDVIYLDFAKAFDSVNHKFLLLKMKPFGLGDVVVRRVEAYISGQVSRVHVGGKFSGTIPMHNGIPQAHFFILSVNGLSDALEALALLFVDDVKMVTLWIQNMNVHSILIAALHWSQKWD